MSCQRQRKRQRQRSTGSRDRIRTPRSRVYLLGLEFPSATRPSHLLVSVSFWMVYKWFSLHDAWYQYIYTLRKSVIKKHTFIIRYNLLYTRSFPVIILLTDSLGEGLRDSRRRLSNGLRLDGLHEIFITRELFAIRNNRKLKTSTADELFVCGS